MRKSLWVIGSIIIYIVTIGIIFTNKLMYIKKKTDLELIEREKRDGFYKEEVYQSLNKEVFTVLSPFGYQLSGTVIQNEHNNKVMIFCHGVTVHSLNSIKYMNIFMERGWNIVLYDHRRHGKSEGKTTSYGHYEKFDLQAVVHWTKERFGQDAVLGIHGESMGAVTTLLYAGMVEDGADFYIADCPFSNLEEQLAYRLKKEFHLPRQLVLPVAEVFLKWRDGYSFKDVSPVDIIDQIKKPVLFIHSEEDDYILPHMTKQLYEKKTGPKKIYLARAGSHGRSFAENQERYKQVIDEFLNGITH